MLPKSRHLTLALSTKEAKTIVTNLTTSKRELVATLLLSAGDAHPKPWADRSMENMYPVTHYLPSLE